MLAKLQYIQEPIKNETTVIIGSPKYSIPDLIGKCESYNIPSEIIFFGSGDKGASK